MKLVRHSAVLALCLVSFSSFAAGQCETLSGCERKFCEIEKQLDVAKAAQNSRQVKGLEEALRYAKANCTDAGLKQEMADKIKDAQDDLAESQSDLKIAESAGDIEKIKKYQREVRKDQLKLNRLLQEKQALNL